MQEDPEKEKNPEHQIAEKTALLALK